MIHKFIRLTIMAKIDTTRDMMSDMLINLTL